MPTTPEWEPELPLELSERIERTNSGVIHTVNGLPEHLEATIRQVWSRKKLICSWDFRLVSFGRIIDHQKGFFTAEEALTKLKRAEAFIRSIDKWVNEDQPEEELWADIKRQLQAGTISRQEALVWFSEIREEATSRRRRRLGMPDVEGESGEDME
jgi:hypothetical protein